MPPSMKTAGLLRSPDPILTTFRGRPSELWPTTVTWTNQRSVLGHSSQSQLSIGSQQPIRAEYDLGAVREGGGEAV